MIALLSAALLSVLVVATFRWLPVPATAFMIRERYDAQRGSAGAQFTQRHDWVPWSEISRHAAVAVIAAEDQKFLEHDGFDFEAIDKALTDSRRGRRLRGASTISQQVAKNLFLWPGQSWVRKGLEACALRDAYGYDHVGSIFPAAQEHGGIQHIANRCGEIQHNRTGEIAFNDVTPY